jgi:hypothetical protein
MHLLQSKQFCFAVQFTKSERGQKCILKWKCGGIAKKESTKKEISQQLLLERALNAGKCTVCTQFFFVRR